MTYMYGEGACGVGLTGHCPPHIDLITLMQTEARVKRIARIRRLARCDGGGV
jgi:hypothetical protein